MNLRTLTLSTALLALTAGTANAQAPPESFTFVKPDQTFIIQPPQRTILTIHPDGTLTFYDKNGAKVKDYDPGPKAREAIKEYMNKGEYER